MFTPDSYPTLYEQQRRNRVLTVTLMVLFVIIFLGLGFGFDALFTSRYVFRVFSLPLVAVVCAGGYYHLKHRLNFGSSTDDDDGDDLIRLFLGFTLKLIVFLIYFGYPYWDSYYEYLYHRPYFKQYSLGWALPLGTILSAVFAIAVVLTSTRWGAKAILWSLHAVPAGETGLASEELKNTVDEMRLAAGVPKPDVYVVSDPDPNAFALGKDPTDSYIVVTSGLLKLLDREELQGVMAHEMSHIRNFDIRLRTVYLALFGSILLLSDWSAKALPVSGARLVALLKPKGVFRIVVVLTWLATILLAPLVVWLLAMAISRDREYLADATAAELTRNPAGLINALRKLENAVQPTEAFKKGVAAFCIVDPRGRTVNRKEGWFANLFATHPPLEKRILALGAISHRTN